MGHVVGPFFMEYLDDLSSSKDLLRGSILPRRPCAWLAPCHRTTRSTSTGPRAASAARCGRSCLNDFGLRMKVQTTPPKEKTGKKWSSFGIGKSISVQESNKIELNHWKQMFHTKQNESHRHNLVAFLIFSRRSECHPCKIWPNPEPLSRSGEEARWTHQKMINTSNYCK